MIDMQPNNPHQRPSVPTQEWQPGDFVKSSFTDTQQGNCVEVARRPGFVALRNSNHGWSDGPITEYTHDEWAAFLKGAKNGEFDV